MRARATGVIALALTAALSAPSRAYFEEVTVGARGLALGPAAVSLVTDVSAYHWNPAGLAELAGLEVLADYAKPFGVQDLNTGAIAIAGHRYNTGWAFGWHRLALSDAYSEDLFSLAAGRRIAELPGGHALAGGATFKFGRIGFQPFPDPETGAIQDYGAVSKGSLDLGLRWTTRWNLDLAWVVRDLLQPRYEFVAPSGGDLLAMRHEVGAAIRWNRESTITAGWSQLDSGISTVNVGIEILFYDVFAIRSGVSNLSRIYESYGSPTEIQYNGGFGVFHRGYYVDAGVTTHRDLGASYRVTVRVPVGSATERE